MYHIEHNELIFDSKKLLREKSISLLNSEKNINAKKLNSLQSSNNYD